MSSLMHVFPGQSKGVMIDRVGRTGSAVWNMKSLVESLLAGLGNGWYLVSCSVTFWYVRAQCDVGKKKINEENAKIWLGE